MTTAADLKAKFWKALHADRTMMIGLVGAEDGHSRPMTAATEGDHGPIWFFTATDTSLVTQLHDGGHAPGGGRAVATFADKGHQLFAAVHGRMVVDNDRATIDRLWNPMIAAWYEGGKTDPKLALLRFDAEQAEIWLNESSVFAGLKLLLGGDPKADYADKVATVRLG